MSAYTFMYTYFDTEAEKNYIRIERGKTKITVT